MDSQLPTKAIPEDVLDSLCSRFLINIPTEERNNMIRVFFQIELAHWFYIDFYKAEKHFLPGCSIKEFSKAIFRHCPFLTEYMAQLDEHFAKWKEYKKSVPTYGAIMVDETLQNIVLVQSYFSKTSWGFPKGKVNEEELPKQCAIREVLEETGFDISGLIEEEYIEATFNEQLARLYVVTNVPVETDFKPKTRGEIKDVKWFHVDDLPTHKKDNAPKVNLGLNPNNFFMAIPYMRTLKKKLAKRRGQKDISTMESPFEALTKYAQPNQPTAGPIMLPQNNPNTKKKASASPTMNGADNKNKTKQQRVFSSQNQSQMDLFMRFKDPQQEFINRKQEYQREGSPGVTQGQGNRGKGQVNGTTSPQKQYHILTRNQGRTVNDLTTDSAILSNGDQYNKRQKFSVPAFVSFKLDPTAIMKAFEIGLSGRGSIR
ncbi:m7GpppN-mRNA hydrolase-like [Asterias rubens]|uniref:m7GpppN-mRNA hydrolase-like n=1 Tax=Asterias rubens TaxID=7604 RepID=UPI0014555DA7|nr:m7GpppN-mRNA hydrolase-like [Asterias rubens]XP_033634806.1 m7GpppN-mRNA hydrolase-like [Asterias rubens]XP_033634807.1 m7GpppN-mRNA hydrolase-like [Asterias rubens]